MVIFRTVNKFLIFLLAVLVSEVALCSALKYGLEATAAFSEFINSSHKSLLKMVLKYFSFIILLTPSTRGDWRQSG